MKKLKKLKKLIERALDWGYDLIGYDTIEDVTEKLQEFEAKIEELKGEIEFEKDQNDELMEQLRDAEKLAKSPIHVVNNILDGGVSFYGYEDLDRASQAAYKKDAQSLRMNSVYKNELDFLILNATKLSVKHSKDYEDLKGYRIMIATIEMIRERVNMIEDPASEEPEVLSDEDRFAQL